MGKHIPDFVSFSKRMAIELVNDQEPESVKRDRAARNVWLGERDYRVVAVDAANVEGGLADVLDSIARAMA